MLKEAICEKNSPYLKDESHFAGSATALYFPNTKQEVIEAVRQTKEVHSPLTFQGSRTGFLGGAVPREGAILNLSHLTAMSEIEEEKGKYFLTVESGVQLAEIQKAAAKRGLFFPVQPTEDTASIGGMFAVNASGPESLFYGECKDFVESVEWVTPDGEVFTVSRGKYTVTDGVLPLPNGKSIDASLLSFPTLQEKAPTDLLDVLCGSEGYFGVALSLKLHLLPLPKELWGVVFFFENEDSLEKFSEATANKRDTFEGAHLTTCEYYSKEALALLEANIDNPLLKKLPAFPSGVTSAIYVELEGEDEDSVTEELSLLLDKFDQCGGKEENTWAESGFEACAPFRAMRHAVPSLLNEQNSCFLSTGFRAESDFLLPVKSPCEILAFYKDFAKAHALPLALYGSILKGQLHLFLTAPTDAQEILFSLAKSVLEIGGTISAKYGIGKAKAPILAALLDEASKESAQKLREFFDSTGRMNP